MHTVKKLLAAAFLLLAVKTYAQEMLYLNGQKFKVSDIENITFTSTRPLLPDVLATYEEYSIFSAALEATGLADSLAYWDRFKNYSCSNNTGGPGSSWGKTQFYVPTTCNIKYSVFAVTDSTFNKIAITNLRDLAMKCAGWYKDASTWYDYPGKDKGVKISTGTDYTNQWNVLNMFVRYHIIKAGAPVSRLLYEYDPENENWNFAFGGEPHEYYETLLPHTLMKIWQPLYQNTGKQTNIWINRWRENNTLTDEVGTFGRDETHRILDTGSLVIREKSDIAALNGYIHTIDRPLVYDTNVAHGVLNERMRVEAEAILNEVSNNGIRFATEEEIGAINQYGNNGTMARMPLNYFENLVVYSHFDLAHYNQDAWRSWNAEEFCLWDTECCDFAIRLPSVPSGTYELRTIFAPASNGALMEAYIGTSTDTATMQLIGSAFDTRFPNTYYKEERDSIGYLLTHEFNDYGVASDSVMRTRGYMRAPASFSRGTYNVHPGRTSDPQVLVDNISASCRYEEGYGTSMMRKILGTVTINQQNDYWLRLKYLNPTNVSIIMGYLDFIELVPKSVTDNPNFSEDWY